MSITFRIASIIFRIFLLLLQGFIVYANIHEHVGDYDIPFWLVVLGMLPLFFCIILTVFYNTGRVRLKGFLQVILVVLLTLAILWQLVIFFSTLPNIADWGLYVAVLCLISSILTFVDVVKYHE